MARRTRAFAGLLTLVAMTASFSQAVLASLCASPAAMATMPVMATSMETGQDGPSEDHGMACRWLGHADASREGGQRCPLTPAATQGCTAMASAPAPAMSIALGTPVSARHVTLDVVEPELLLADVFYHPPRA